MHAMLNFAYKRYMSALLILTRKSETNTLVCVSLSKPAAIEVAMRLSDTSCGSAFRLSGMVTNGGVPRKACNGA